MGTQAKKKNIINIRKKLRDNELGRIHYNNQMRIAALVEALMFIGISTVLATAELGDASTSFGSMVCFPSLLALAMIVSGFVVSLADIHSVVEGQSDLSVKNRWINILSMFFYECGGLLGLSFIMFQVIPEGLSSYLTTDWPGGIIIYLVIPVATLISYIVVNRKCMVTRYESFMVLEVVIILFMASCMLSILTNIDIPVNEAFCRMENVPAVVFLMMFTTWALWYINKLSSNICEMNKQRMIESVWSGSARKVTLHDLLQYNHRVKQAILMIMNIMLLAISLLTMFGSIELFQYGAPTNPLAMSMIIGLVSLLTIPYNILGIHIKSSNIFPGVYKYLFFIRTACTLINLATAVMMISYSGAGAWDDFTSQWGGDWLTYFAAPVISVFMLFLECNFYTLKSSLLSISPIIAILCYAKFFISYGSIEEELVSKLSFFFEGSRFVLTIIEVAAIAVVIYAAAFINTTDERYRDESVIVEHDRNDSIKLYVCGTRSGVAPTSKEYREFGQSTGCYVLRDGSYGLIIECGCGLVYAPEKLKGCKNVDIVLSDTSFSTLMGLLAVPNPCPGATVRIFGPFGNGRNFINMNQFAVPPLWPVNVIVGQCISVIPDIEFPLNNMYSIRFSAANEKATRYKIRIAGAVSIAYTGSLTISSNNDSSWAKGCDLLIYDALNGLKAGCSFASYVNAGYLLMSNYAPLKKDAELAAEEAEARKIFPRCSYARQGEVYHLE